MLLLQAKRQACKRCAKSGVTVQCCLEVRRFFDLSGSVVQCKDDVNGFTIGYACCRSVCGTDADQALSAHQRDPGSPSMSVDGH